MKKPIAYLLIWCITISAALAQNSRPSNFPVKTGEPKKANFEFSTNGISPFTATLLAQLKIREAKPESDITLDTALIQKYGLINQNEILYTNAFLLVDENFEPSTLSKYGFKQGSHQGKYATGLIPVNRIQEMQNDGAVKYIQIGEPVKPQLDAARADTWVDWVQQGYQLPQGYNGSGVVVGIIDGGIDYTHPNFYDATGTNNYRIKRVWEQNSSGTPPSGYNYGRELTTQSAILNAQRDNTDGSHGTHVTGIAAGAGGGVNTTYTGVALQSDIVIVSYKYSPVNSEIADGIAYIMNYATSVGKPCVINMSLGQHIGAHDGTSLFDQYCDGIVGQGKLLVGAAGNQGTNPLYLGKTYTSSDTLLLSFILFPNSSLGTNGTGAIDIWGNSGQNFKVAVNIYNTNNNQLEDYTPYVYATANNSYSYTLSDADVFSDDCLVTISAETNAQNNKRRILVTIDHTDQDDNYKWALLEVIAYNNQTKMWGGPIGGDIEFTGNGYGFPFLDGSTNSTIGEIGGTGNSIITVGAYTSKNSWTAFNGSSQSTTATVEAIADFSSKGPTADGRTKPDITAPGNVVVSSVNHFDTGNYPASSDEVVSGVTNGATTWYYAKMQGTSMAAPVVTGILALWLQAYPNLTLTQAKTLIKDNAWTDAFTGTIPVNGSNTWGWGKIDAHEGLKDLLTKIPAQPTITPSGTVTICQGQSATLSAPSGYSSYLWSNNATTQSINVTTAGSYTVRVTNSQGYISPASSAKQVTVTPQPTTPLVSANPGNSICQGQSTTLTVTNPCSGCTYAWSPGGQSGTSLQVISAGNYSVMATNSCGNVSSSSTSITTNPQPTTPTVNVSPSNSFCQGQSATLTVNNPCSGCTYAWSPGGQTGTSIQVTSTNNYTANAINSCGQVSSNPVSIIVNQLPPTPTATINGNQIESSSSTGNQWYFNGALISGATQQTYTPQQSGNYYVVVIDGNGCSSSPSNTVSFVPTGIGNTDVPSAVIYPNPTTGELNILFSSNQTDVMIELFDMTGKQIIWQEVKDVTANYFERINLNVLTKGIYNLRLITHDQVSFHRVLLIN